MNQCVLRVFTHQSFLSALGVIALEKRKSTHLLTLFELFVSQLTDRDFCLP